MPLYQPNISRENLVGRENGRMQVVVERSVQDWNVSD